MAKKRRRLRRSNGAGTISCSSREDLRKPWYVKVTVGKELNDDGKLRQKRKLLGYYETEEDATIALAHYMEELKANGGLAPSGTKLNMTVKEVWDVFVKEQTGKNISESRRNAYGYTWKYIPEKIKNATFEILNYQIWSELFNDLRDNKKLGYSTIKRIRTDTGMLYDYAKKLGIKTENYPKMYNLGKSPKKGKTLVFSADEIRKLWNMYLGCKGNAEAQFTVKVVLMLIYNGCRIDEFLSLKTKDISISERYFTVVDAKTPAGVRRIPINKAMVPIYQEIYDSQNEYFLTNPKNNRKYTYANFRDSYWDRLSSELHWNKDMTPHNARKTFSSYMMYYNVLPTYQKLIFGHEGALDLQEKVYTVVPHEKLVEEIDKIPEPILLVDLTNEVL